MSALEHSARYIHEATCHRAGSGFEVLPRPRMTTLKRAVWVLAALPWALLAIAVALAFWAGTGSR